MLGLPVACGEWTTKERSELERVPEERSELPPESPVRPRPGGEPGEPRYAEGDRLAALPPDSLIRSAPHGPVPDSIAALLERRLEAAPAGAPVAEYLLWLPPGLERRDRRWPMIVYLHGRSLRGDDLDDLTRYGLPQLLDHDGAIPFVVLAPQLSGDGNWSGAALERVAELIEAVARRYPVDRERIYLTGYSMGGGGVWRMAFRWPDTFAAAVPVAAHTPRPTGERISALRDLPILAFHGDRDEVTPLTRAEEMIAALREAGADAELRTIAGAGHGDLTRLYRDPALYAWMLEHARGSR
ncbi:MAG: prolyl oligopeptidase family serine peptidase [Gemmatimonadota bacterium]|nr:prolyl oligopeptidase family serine peptidase [Gemmatimonadota bacterium]